MLDASTTGDCSSRLQDSEVDVLRVRVGVLEGALRRIADPTNHHYKSDYVRPEEIARAVLAGGEAGKEKP